MYRKPHPYWRFAALLNVGCRVTCSQAWQTFIRDHAITIVQSQRFDWHNWARDLLTRVRFRLRVFTYHLTAFVIASVTDPSCWAVWHTGHPLLIALARPRVSFTRIVTLTTKSTALACRCPTACKVDLLTTDQIRAPPRNLRYSHVKVRSSWSSRTRIGSPPTSLEVFSRAVQGIEQQPGSSAGTTPPQIQKPMNLVRWRMKKAPRFGKLMER